MTEKHYDVRIPSVMYGMDMGLPLDPEVRAFLEGFHKNEILAIADDYDRKVAAGEDPTFYPGVGPAGGVETRAPEPGDDALENAILASVGEEADTVEVEVEQGVPVPEVPVVLEPPRELDPDSDNYEECDRDDLYEEARRRRIPNIPPKIGHAKLVSLLRKHDAENL